MPMTRVAVVLVEPAEPGNVGAVARAMKNFGAGALVLVRPRCEPMHGMARAFSAGASEILRAARRCETLDEAVAPFALTIALTGVQGHHRVLECVDALPTRLLAGRSAQDPIGLVLGREESGLTNEEANRCGARWKLPTEPGFPSLNLAQAAGIALFAIAEARRSLGWPATAVDAGVTARSLRAGASGRSRDAAASQEEVSRLIDHMRREMVEWGYEDTVRTDASMVLLRSLMARAGLTHREAQLIRGLLRQARWRLENGPPPGGRGGKDAVRED